MARGAWHPRLTTWVDRVDARWQQLGFSPAVRRELRMDLVTDLSQARLGGAPLEEVLALDPVRFAEDVAVARGSQLPVADAAVPASSSSTPATRDRTKDPRGAPVVFVTVAGLLGSVMGGVGGLVAFLPLMGWAFHHAPAYSVAQGAMMLAAYAGAGLVAAVSGGFAAAGAYGGSPVSAASWRRATLGLLLSGVVATIVTVSFAAATGYSTTTPVLLTELALVVSSCAAGLVVFARSTRSGFGRGARVGARSPR